MFEAKSCCSLAGNEELPDSLILVIASIVKPFIIFKNILNLSVTMTICWGVSIVLSYSFMLV